MVTVCDRKAKPSRRWILRLWGNCLAVVVCFLFWNTTSTAQEVAGGISGTVTDREFDVPLSGATVAILEAERKTETNDSGHFVFHGLKPGAYTMTATRAGFERVMKTNVVVNPGTMTAATLALPAEYADMEEFTVRPLELGKTSDEPDSMGADLAAELSAKLARELASQLSSEVGLLNLRAESSGIMDAVGAEMMSKAGASDAAQAMKLVAGATVTDDKYAVIRGLSDRFINTQVNGMMMPTADPDVRAVQLDLFPSALLESVRVHKTFTPDLPGNTSGGSIDIVTPDPPVDFKLAFGAGVTYNSQATGNKDFMTSGQAFDYFGLDPADREKTIESGTVPDPSGPDFREEAELMNKQIKSLSSVMAPTREPAPPNHKWSLTYGDRFYLNNDTSIGWLGAFTYASKYSHREGVQTSTVGTNGTFGPPDASSSYGIPYKGETEESSRSVGWGLGTVIELEHQDYSLKLNYLRTQQTEEKAFSYWDEGTASKASTNFNEAYLLNESLTYTARSLESLQLLSTVPLHFLDAPPVRGFDLQVPQLEWAMAFSNAVQDQPDRRFFAGYYDTNPFGPKWKLTGAEEDLAQRSWRIIDETTDFYRADLTWPFKVGEERDGKFKFGWSSEDTFRTYEQDTIYHLQGKSAPFYYATFHPREDRWSEVFLNPDRLGYPDVNDPNSELWILRDFSEDVDYTGLLQISASYAMAELPVFPWLKIIGGMRVEETVINTEVHASDGDDERVSLLQVKPFVTGEKRELLLDRPDPRKGETLAKLANAAIERTDLLPSIGLVLNLFGDVSLRGTWSQTIGRPTFKELTPVAQQDTVGATPFAGNPALEMSELTNYDLRLEWNPGDGRLLSLGAFAKDIELPIDYSQAPTTQNQLYVIPFNYPEGDVKGIEVEGRLELGHVHEVLKGLSIGANYTWLEASVTRPKFELEGLQVNFSDVPETRRMKDQPEFLANFYLMYDLNEAGTSLGLFLNHKGDTLVAGDASPGGEYFPNRIAKPYTSVDINFSQKIWENGKLTLSLGNVLNPKIEEVWQSDYVDEGETTATSHRKGITYSLSFSTKW